RAGPGLPGEVLMLRTPLDEVKEIARSGEATSVPVYREIVADLETPVSAYLKVARGDHSFLLESVEGGERLARYSFIGTEPYRILRTGDNTAPGEVPGDPLGPIEEGVRRPRRRPEGRAPPLV